MIFNSDKLDAWVVSNKFNRCPKVAGSANSCRQVSTCLSDEIPSNISGSNSRVGAVSIDEH